MRRVLPFPTASPALLIALALPLSLGAGACKRKVACKEWSTFTMPKGTEIEECYSFEVNGKTTAGPGDFEAMLGGAGLQKGRPVPRGYAGAKTEIWFSPPGLWPEALPPGDKPATPPTNRTMYEILAKPAGRFAIKRFEGGTDSTAWISEATYQRLATNGADVATARAKVAPAAAILASAARAKVPATCSDEVLAVDPLLTKRSARFFMDVDEPTAAPSAAQRGPSLLPRTGDRSDAAIAVLLDERLVLDDIATTRVLPVIRFTSFEAPSAPSSVATGLSMFSGGKATFEVAAIDLEAKKVLCRAVARAESSGRLENKSAGADLDDNIELAAVGAFRRMNRQLLVAGPPWWKRR